MLNIESEEVVRALKQYKNNKKKQYTEKRLKVDYIEIVSNSRGFR